MSVMIEITISLQQQCIEALISKNKLWKLKIGPGLTRNLGPPRERPVIFFHHLPILHYSGARDAEACIGGKLSV